MGYYDGSTYGSFSTHSNASPYSAYDMAGNVWEWVSDCWDPNYYSISPMDNPIGPTPGDSVDVAGGSINGNYTASMRGGFWRDNQGKMSMGSLRSAYRGKIFRIPRRKRHISIGLRCVRLLSGDELKSER